MKVQKAISPETEKKTWLVLDENYQIVEPIREFFTYLRNLERSPNTIRSYAYHLKLYWEYLSECKIDWRSVNIVQLAEFITWLRSPQGKVISLQTQESKRTESTVNVILTSVCMLYDFHEKTGKVSSIPLYRDRFMPGGKYKGFLHHITKSKPVRTRLLKLKQPQKQPKTLSQEQIEALVGACKNTRDKFLICLLNDSGLRIGQALGLHHSDIQSWDNVLTVVPRDDNANDSRAKTKSPYQVPITKELMALYSQYVENEFLEILGDNISDYVFVNFWGGKRGQAMSYSNVMSLFTRLRRKTGIAIPVTPHKIRHTHATDLIREGVGMAYVQRRLGHASIQTTNSIYVHVTNEDMKREYQKYLETKDESAPEKPEE